MVYRTFVASLLLMLSLAAPAAAHKGHHHLPAAAAAPAPASGAHGIAASVVPGAAQAPHAMPSGMMPMMHDDDDRSTMSTGERLLDWLGRLHVSVIHFPLAFFPAALVTALAGRRRPGFQKPVQFLVIAGGVTAPIAAMLGWLDGGMVLHDSDPLLHVHRWLGTAIGLGGLGLGIWAWQRPGADRSGGMLAALTLITAALLVQGWYGGSMVHGIDHMSW